MTPPRTRSGRLLEEMAHAVVPVPDAEEQRSLEERIVPRIEELHANVLQRRRSHGWRKSWVLVAAAGLLAGIGGAWHAVHAIDHRAAAVHVSGGTALARLEARTGGVLVDGAGVAPGATLRSGQTVTTARDGRSVLHFDRDATVAVDPDGRLVLEAAFGGDPADQGVSLGRGTVNVHVAHLAPGRHFSVHTPDAIVQVHGTRFRVSVTGEPPVTTVTVTEGRVLVHSGSSDTFLDPGDSWASHHDATTPAESPTAAPSATGDEPLPSSRPSPQLVPSAVTDRLAEQNGLFERAMQRRRADDTGALVLFDQLLSKYPRGPLAETSEVERFRALARLGRSSEAAAAARRYLAQHPEGFAQAEARRLTFGGDAPRPQP